MTGYLLEEGDKIVPGDLKEGPPGSGMVKLGLPPENAVGQFGTQGSLDASSERPSNSDGESALAKAKYAFKNFGTQTWRSFVGTPGNRLFRIDVERRGIGSARVTPLGRLDPSKPILPIPIE